MTYNKKLIEVALPLEAINRESAREKSIRHGHPSTLHLWWSRKPLATCRAVLFASLVDDPSQHPDRFPTEEAQANERVRLFKLIEALVKWENTTNETILNQARQEILRSTYGNPPPVLDPFCGGGSIPLEAQRLGLEAHASDLNPVAVLITKALIEIPPRFAGQPPVNPKDRAPDLGLGEQWRGASGLAADVRYYGQWMRDEAERRIGHLYPKVELPSEQGGGEATVIAWLWARTVKCPNPACGAQMPLTSKFSLSTKKGREAWVEPIVDQARKTVRFEVRSGQGAPRAGTVNRRGARCVVCDSPAPFSHVRSEGKAGRMSERLMAVVAEGSRGRTYVSPDQQHEELARAAEPQWAPVAALPDNPRDFKTPNYGMRTFADLFTDRQLLALTTFSDLVTEAQERVQRDAVAADLVDDNRGLQDSGNGARAYADAIASYLGMTVSRLSNSHCTLAIWSQSRDQTVNAFSRQAVPMTWDFPEINPFARAAGDPEVVGKSIERIINGVSTVAPAGFAWQGNAADCLREAANALVSTDPPYYDNVGYADLADFFYVWLRRSLADIYPDLFATVQTPKTDELIASPYRHDGSKAKAEEFFESGLRRSFTHMRSGQHQDYPLTIYYAFKQAEVERVDGDGAGPGVVSSTGWETMLQGLLDSKFSISGTWPMRTERPTGVKVGMNALASSIVLVCRPRPVNAPIATRTDFIRALRRELPLALQRLQYGNIAPVDLAQASIGPGMTVFSRYSKVLEASGQPMRVRTALQLINQALDEVLAEQEGEFDGDTRWAITWFEQYGTKEGPYGEAETLSKAKDTSIAGLVEAAILEARGGKVRLLARDDLRADWDPLTERRLTIWEVAQHLIRALHHEGETGASELVRILGGPADQARDLAYRLYTVCERNKWAEEALAYNSLVIAWPELQRLAGTSPVASEQVLGFTE